MFGRVRRAIEAAEANIMSAEENRRDVLVSLVAEVARNYVGVAWSAATPDRGAEYVTAQSQSAELTRARV